MASTNNHVIVYQTMIYFALIIRISIYVLAGRVSLKSLVLYQ
jgi:hypothetical protein